MTVLELLHLKMEVSEPCVRALRCHQGISGCAELKSVGQHSMFGVLHSKFKHVFMCLVARHYFFNVIISFHVLEYHDFKKV